MTLASTEFFLLLAWQWYMTSMEPGIGSVEVLNYFSEEVGAMFHGRVVYFAGRYFHATFIMELEHLTEVEHDMFRECLPIVFYGCARGLPWKTSGGELSRKFVLKEPMRSLSCIYGR